jgi:hypothetical protein
MFEIFVGLKVRIVQRDGFVKYGVLLEISEDNVLIKFDDERKEVISRQNIVSCTEVKK